MSRKSSLAYEVPTLTSAFEDFVSDRNSGSHSSLGSTSPVSREEYFDLAEDMAYRTGKLAHELAKELAKKDVKAMTESELTTAKKNALEKIEQGLVDREVEVLAKELEVDSLKEKLDARTGNLQAELRGLQKSILGAESTLKTVIMKHKSLAHRISREKREHSDKIKQFDKSFFKLKELEIRYGELDERATDFVDDSLLKYFESEE